MFYTSLGLYTPEHVGTSITLELLGGALVHDLAIAPVEFCPLDPRRDFPKHSANDLAAGYTEDFLRRAIKGSKTPVRIEREETLPHPLKEAFDKGLLGWSCPLSRSS